MSYNDPPEDSPFLKLSETQCKCIFCGAVVDNTTEARDAHVADAEFSDDDAVRRKHEVLYT